MAGIWNVTPLSPGMEAEYIGEIPGDEEISLYRQGDFVDNLCRKLFSYALGRGLLVRVGHNALQERKIHQRLAAEKSDVYRMASGRFCQQ